MTRISNALESEHHMPVMNSLVFDDFIPGMCCSAQTLFCNEQHQRRLGNRTLETNPHTLAFCTYTEAFMDPYTIGRLALPVVIGIMAVAAILTLAMGIFTAVKTMASVQRFFQHMEETRRPSVTINFFGGRRTSKPPMRAEK